MLPSTCLQAAAAAEERAHAAELRAVELTAQAVERVQQDADGQISDLREMLQGERDEKAELQGQLEVGFGPRSGLLAKRPLRQSCRGKQQADTKLQTGCELRTGPHSGARA